jgi:hypothetical protein
MTLRACSNLPESSPDFSIDRAIEVALNAVPGDRFYEASRQRGEGIVLRPWSPFRMILTAAHTGRLEKPLSLPV